MKAVHRTDDKERFIAVIDIRRSGTEYAKEKTYETGAEQQITEDKINIAT
jgi:hypothetical protein